MTFKFSCKAIIHQQSASRELEFSFIPVSATTDEPSTTVCDDFFFFVGEPFDPFDEPLFSGLIYSGLPCSVPDGEMMKYTHSTTSCAKHNHMYTPKVIEESIPCVCRWLCTALPPRRTPGCHIARTTLEPCDYPAVVATAIHRKHGPQNQGTVS